MISIRQMVGGSWRWVRRRLHRRRRTPIRGLALAGFCLIVATMVAVTVVAWDAGRGAVLVTCLVGLFTVATVLRPEGVAGTVVLALLAAAYLYGTTLADGTPRPWLVLALTVALYLAHALAALAAAVPPGATVERAVLRRWFRRIVEVLAVSLPLGLLVLVLQQPGAGDLVRVLGYVAVVGVVAIAVAYARGQAPWRD